MIIGGGEKRHRKCVMRAGYLNLISRGFKLDRLDGDAIQEEHGLGTIDLMNE